MSAGVLGTAIIGSGGELLPTGPLVATGRRHLSGGSSGASSGGNSAGSSPPPPPTPAPAPATSSSASSSSGSSSVGECRTMMFSRRARSDHISDASGHYEQRQVFALKPPVRVAAADNNGQSDSVPAGTIACSTANATCSLCTDCECPGDLAKTTLTLPSGNSCWRCESPQCYTYTPTCPTSATFGCSTKVFSTFFSSASESCSLSGACLCPSPLVKLAFTPVTGASATTCFVCVGATVASKFAPAA